MEWGRFKLNTYLYFLGITNHHQQPATCQPPQLFRKLATKFLKCSVSRMAWRGPAMGIVPLLNKGRLASWARRKPRRFFFWRSLLSSGFRTGGGFLKSLLEFSPLFGEMIQFDQYFSDGLKPPTSCFGSEVVFKLPAGREFLMEKR